MQFSNQVPPSFRQWNTILKHFQIYRQQGHSGNQRVRVRSQLSNAREHGTRLGSPHESGAERGDAAVVGIRVAWNLRGMQPGPDQRRLYSGVEHCRFQNFDDTNRTSSKELMENRKEICCAGMKPAQKVAKLSQEALPRSLQSRSPAHRQHKSL